MRRGPEPVKGGLLLTKTTPSFAIAIVDFEDLIEVLNGLWKVLAGPQNCADGVHGLDGVWVCAKALLICEQGIVDIAETFRQASCKAVSYLNTEG